MRDLSTLARITDAERAELCPVHDMLRDDLIVELDAHVEAANSPNLRGFAVRCRGSRYYRAAPAGRAENGPTTADIAAAVAGARLDIRVCAMRRVRGATAGGAVTSSRACVRPAHHSGPHRDMVSVRWADRDPGASEEPQ